MAHRLMILSCFVVCLAFAGCQSLTVEQAQTDREFDKVTGELVMAAQVLAQSSAYEQAIAKLNEARTVPNLIPYEDSTISSMLGGYAYEMNDIPATIGHFQNALSAGGLNNHEAKATQSNIDQLQYNANSVLDLEIGACY